jgi:cobalt-zinc-cadmium resistance protein CzcA
MPVAPVIHGQRPEDMIGRITSYALRHRAIVLALLVLFILAGINAFIRLPVEAFPDVSNMSVQVITLFPGHAAEEVERLVTIPIENQMNSVPKLVSLRSISLFGLSQVTLVFEDGAEPDYVRNQVSQFLSVVTLPAGAQASLSPNATPIGEIYRYTLKAPKGYPPVEVKALEDWVVERKLRTVPGVVDIVGFGGPTKQYQVQVDPAKLKSYNLSLKQVFDALSNGNRNAGGSYVEHGSEMYVVRGLGFVRDTADIGAIAVDSRNGAPIRISDIGTVTIGNGVRLGQVGMLFKQASGELDDDPDAVQGIVIMRRGENPRNVLDGIHAKVEEINEHYLPGGIRLVPHYDRTELIHRTLHTVRKNMLEGIGLVVLVLVLFLGLGNFRSALVVALAVPISLLGAYLILDLRGIPANLISMGAIDFGIIVDSAVVIVENLIRNLHEKSEKTRSLPGAIVEAVRQMGRPILFSKAILLTAFIPVYTLQRVEGRIFRPMALTLTYALVTGTLFAIFVVPPLLSFALKRKMQESEPWIVRRLVRVYRPLLVFALGWRKLIFALSALLLLAGGIAYFFIGSEFLPKLDEGALWVRIFMPKSISPSEAAALVNNVRHRLASFPETKDVLSQLGRPDDGTDINGFDVCEFNVNLKPRAEWKTASNREALADAMGKNLSEIPGIDSQFSQYIEDNVNEAVSGIKSELAIKLYGEDPMKLQELADKIADVVSAVPGAKDVGTDQFTGQPQIQITVDRAAIARFGVSVSDIQSVIETALGGAVATQVLEGERTFDLVVKIAPKAVSDLDSIRNLPVFGANSERLTLGALTKVEVRSGLAKIMREGNERRIAIKLSVRGRDLGSLVHEAEARANAAVKLPPGYRMVWTGAFENQQRAMHRLLVVVPITIVAIFFLLFTAFDSGKFAALILLNVPFAAVGGLLALPIAGLDLSVSAMVGFIALFGVSIQSGVLLVERVRELRHLGKPVREAVIEGAESRLRPVMMTALMAAFGLLPAALSTDVGAETARPFAVVIIGGLVTATLLTLLLLPILYPSFESEKAEY